MVHSIACRQAQVSARLEDLHEVFPLIPILSIKDFQEETAYIYIYIQCLQIPWEKDFHIDVSSGLLRQPSWLQGCFFLPRLVSVLVDAWLWTLWHQRFLDLRLFLTSGGLAVGKFCILVGIPFVPLISNAWIEVL